MRSFRSPGPAVFQAVLPGSGSLDADVPNATSLATGARCVARGATWVSVRLFCTSDRGLTLHAIHQVQEATALLSVLAVRDQPLRGPEAFLAVRAGIAHAALLVSRRVIDLATCIEHHRFIGEQLHPTCKQAVMPRSVLHLDHIAVGDASRLVLTGAHRACARFKVTRSAGHGGAHLIAARAGHVATRCLRLDLLPLMIAVTSVCTRIVQDLAQASHV